MAVVYVSLRMMEAPRTVLPQVHFWCDWPH
jgi:hypothetical protein